MRSLTLSVAALVLPGALAAQSTVALTDRVDPDAVMFVFERFADIFGSRLVAAFEAIPADRYDFRPMPAQRTVGNIAQHLEDANYELCEQLGVPKTLERPARANNSLADTAKSPWPKDTLVARLRASLRFCDAALDGVPHLESAAHANILLALETDLAEHYSQIAIYMRLLGLVPPSALPPAPRATVELPGSELARYVGVYHLAQGLELEVTLRDGGLFARSNAGGAPVRLWPEGGATFFAKEADAEIRFMHDATGAVTAVVVHQYGRDRFGRKIR
ncbi:MAG: DUF3471 domain-containing protein [Gemmatimonadota bacterium]|nr:DUF3471 domain-containing protein [Gemmatimonadota bacterium]